MCVQRRYTVRDGVDNVGCMGNDSYGVFICVR